MATTTQQKLDEAIEARHLLAIGQAEVSIQIGQRQVQFTPATLGNLERYIAELRATLAGRKPTRNRIQYVVPQ